MIGEKDKSIKLSVNKVTKDKFEKELHSFKNKLHGKNLIWFESLSDRKQRNVVHQWKRYKFLRKENNNTPRYIRTWNYNTNMGEWTKVIEYKPKLKYFLKDIQSMRSFRVSTQDIRNNTIEQLLNSK